MLERGGQVQLVYKHAISTLQPAHPLNLGPEQGERRRGGRVLNAFDGNGAIEVARGERAVIVVPELPREGARRSAEARLEEARGPRRGDRHRRRGRDGRSACAQSGPATLLGKGQVEEIAELAQGRRTRSC